MGKNRAARGADARANKRLEASRDATAARETTPARPGTAIDKDRSETPPAATAPPHGDRETARLGRNQSLAPPERSPGERAGPIESDRKDAWGFLPVHVRDVFRAQGGGDMPAQYREWIDAYYRRLNKQRP
jgi:hypothetical protein